MGNVRSSADWLLEKGVNTFERIYPIIRGLPHNRLAIVVVCAGLAVVVGPLWEPYLRALTITYLDIGFDPPNHPIWGVLLVCAGLLYHLFALRADGLRKELSDARAEQEKQRQVERKRQHDGQIIRAFQVDFPEDEIIGAILGSLYHDRSIFSLQQNRLYDIDHRIGSADFCLLDDQVREQANELKKSIVDLNAFISGEFFTLLHGTSYDRYCLRPDWDEDRCGNTFPTSAQTAQYHAKARELDVLIKAVDRDYRNLIIISHERVL